MSIYATCGCNIYAALKSSKNHIGLARFYSIMIFRVFINEHTGKTLISVSTRQTPGSDGPSRPAFHKIIVSKKGSHFWKPPFYKDL